MFVSFAKPMDRIDIPNHQGLIQMLPFELEDLNNVPTYFKYTINKMLSNLPIKKGTAFLTIDGKHIKKNDSHRRGGVHIDGNYCKVNNSWQPPRWNDYQSSNGGMIIVSDYAACRGWNGTFKGKIKYKGDCSDVDINTESFMLESNIVYYANSQFIHESLPISKNIHRNLIRITLPEEYPLMELLGEG